MSVPCLNFKISLGKALTHAFGFSSCKEYSVGISSGAYLKYVINLFIVKGWFTFNEKVTLPWLYLCKSTEQITIRSKRIRTANPGNDFNDGQVDSNGDINNEHSVIKV